MPYLISDLVVDRVDIVEEGANSAAFISLYKRKEHSSTMDAKEILEKMKPEHAAVIQAEFTARDTAVAELAKVRTELATANDNLSTANAELAKLKQPEGSPEEDILKGLPEEAKAAVAKVIAQKDAAEEALRKSRETEEQTTAVAKAAELKALPIAQDKLVEIIKKATPELLEVLTTINTAIEGTVLGEVGKNKTPDAPNTTGNAAWDKIEAKATEVAKAKGISKAKAITQVIDENPDLYKDYLKGGAN